MSPLCLTLSNVLLNKVLSLFFSLLGVSSSSKGKKERAEISLRESFDKEFLGQVTVFVVVSTKRAKEEDRLHKGKGG